jgi:hypothetical protein
MDLGIGLEEGGVGDALLGRPLAGPLKHARGQVNAQHEPGRGQPGGVAGALAVAAADIEYPLAAGDGGGIQEPAVVGVIASSKRASWSAQ